MTIAFDADLIRRYDALGPRYTSYPTAPQFHDQFSTADYRTEALRSSGTVAPLSLYCHIPFCATVCFYCGCSKIITANRRRAAPYLQRLHREIALQGALFGDSRPVEQLHWGGGTPTFIDNEQMCALMDEIGRHFRLLDDDSGEYSIEIDPREVDADKIRLLRSLGFNRLSLGVQDFDPVVQRAVNRIQSLEVTEAALHAAREAGFRSISLDLIYGLPKQTVETFDKTLTQTIALAPQRLSVYSYAHLPALFKMQGQIKATELPSAADKLAILQHTIRRLGDAGYVYIGMDHFAHPDDELAVALRMGTLQRNFQGYSTRAGSDLVGLGMTSIGQIGNCYSQNAKTLDDYYSALDNDQLPINRGLILSTDDRVRRAVIQQLMCRFSIDIIAFEKTFSISFKDYFADELTQLEVMAADRLLTLDEHNIEVQPAGRLLIRNIAMVFDHYLSEQKQQRFSRAI